MEDGNDKVMENEENAAQVSVLGNGPHGYAHFSMPPSVPPKGAMEVKIGVNLFITLHIVCTPALVFPCF